MADSPWASSSLDSGCGRKKILRHVTALTESRFKLFQNKKDLPVISPGLMLRVDIDRADLTTVLPSGKIRASAVMGMVEPKTGRPRSIDEPPLPLCGDERRAFL